MLYSFALFLSWKHDISKSYISKDIQNTQLSLQELERRITSILGKIIACGAGC